MKVVVIALGKIGLPLAVHIAKAGHQVIGCDINETVVAQVNAGQPPFPGETGLEQALQDVIANGSLRAHDDTVAALKEGPDLAILVPPLILDANHQPEWTLLDRAFEAVGRGLRAGTTVSVETTVPVGTTRERLAPALAAASGLRSERDFFCVFSPERVFSGRIFADLATYPKLVGGLSAEGEARGVDAYRSFITAEVRAMGSAEAAEMTKLAETTYRDVNIALANEFAIFAAARGIDVNRVIGAANSQPFSHIHQPGIAVGGHCIPVYPHLYLNQDPAAKLPRLAREVNETMPAYAVQQLAQTIGDLEGRKVLILGIAFRGGVKETAYSGAFGLREALAASGAVVVASDPLYTDAELLDLGFTPWHQETIDAAVVQADHGEYQQLKPSDLPGVRGIVDGRRVVDSAPFVAAGISFRTIG